MLAAACAMGAETARRGVRLRVDPDAVAEILPLAFKAVDIFKRASAREARHAAELRKRGIAEVPPEGDERYVLDTAGIGEFAFDGRGEIYIDRRFVTDEEMKTVRAIEGWIVKWFPRQTEKHRHTIADSTVYPTIVIAFGSDTIRSLHLRIHHGKGVIGLASPHISHGKAIPEFHSLNSGNGE